MGCVGRRHIPGPAEALDRWVLLARGGRLGQGLWYTGAALSAVALEALVRPRSCRTDVRHLPEQALWGRDIDDERYVLTAHL